MAIAECQTNHEMCYTASAKSKVLDDLSEVTVFVDHDLNGIELRLSYVILP